jgi:hypothetical protein
VTVPDPLAADGRVTVDSASRTLIVKPAEATGHAAVLWRSAHRDLLRAEESGRYYAVHIHRVTVTSSSRIVSSPAVRESDRWPPGPPDRRPSSGRRRVHA